MTTAPITVLKLGGSILVDDQSLAPGVREIDTRVRDGHRVVAVVSALGTTTDRLAARAHAIAPDPQPTAYAAFLATGTTVSFGGVTSSVDLPCEMSHASVPERWRAIQVLPPGLVRLSVGIEDASDLVADLESALNRAGRPEKLAATAR